MTRELDDLIDLDGLTPAQAARLRRVHELLVDAGPPAELPHGLADPPGAAMRAQVAPLARVVPLAARRRRSAVLLVAAAVAAVCFGSGYLIADQTHQGAVSVAQVVSLEGSVQRDSFASLRVGSADPSGNLPLQLTVSGLPSLRAQGDRYVLMVWQHGRPSAFVGMFKVSQAGPTTVSFSVPFAISKATRFVVTELAPGAHFPGHVVMTSS